MSVWDDIVKGVSDATAATAKKAENATNTAKLKYALHLEQEELEECYKQLGKIFYEFQRTGDDLTAEIAALTSAADKHMDKMEKLRRALQKSGCIIVCPECGARLKGNMTFCPACGTRQSSGK